MKAGKTVVRILFCVLALALCIVLVDVVKLGVSYHNNHQTTTATTAAAATQPAVPADTTVPDTPPAEDGFEVSYKAYDGYETVSLEEMNKAFEKNASKYSRDIRERLTKIYHGLVNNIDLYRYYMTFSGFPDAITFINEKFVKPLGTLSFIKTIYHTDPDFYDYLNEYQSSCYVHDENGVYLLWESFIGTPRAPCSAAMCSSRWATAPP